MASEKLNQLELDIAKFLLEKLEHLEMTPERVSEIAQYVLKSLPNDLTDDKIDKIIPSLDDKFLELAEIVHQHLKERDEMNSNDIAGEAALMIKQGKIDEANELMKNYFIQKL